MILVGEEWGGKDVQDKRLDYEDYEAPLLFSKGEIFLLF